METKRRNKISAEELHKERGEIKQVANDLGFRSVSDSLLKEEGDFDDSDFYGFAAISNKMRVGRNLNLRGD